MTEYKGKKSNKTALAITALFIFSNILIGKIAYKNGRLENIESYALLNFNQQAQCSSEIGQLQAQIGYLETLRSRNL